MQEESAALDRPAPPARERVYRYVRDGIMDGRFAAGSFLEEEQVSTSVGVSRTPVREAFQQLHSERLIDLLPRRGAMVRVVTAQELLEVYDTRLMIESHAARRLCHARHGAPPAMHALLRQMRAQSDRFDAGHARLNTAFHEALVDAAGNGVTAALYAALSARQERVAATTVSLDPGRQQLILAEHEALVAALDGHDAAACLRVLAAHLQPVQGILTRLPD